MKRLSYTDDRIDAVRMGAPLTADERADLLEHTPNFEECRHTREHMPGLMLPIGITYNQLRREFESARIAAGLPHVRFHDLRHTAASWWLGTGASLATVRDLLGHSSVSVTSRYLHLLPGDLVRGAAAVDAMLGRTKTAQDDSSD